MSLPKSIHNLSSALSSMPGVGPKLSNRLAIYLAVKGKPLSTVLVNALNDVSMNIRECSICGNLSSENECPICREESRDRKILIVVEDPLDLESLESTGSYSGLYHVLNGCISPVNGIGPEDINLESLFNRIKDENFNELIFALNPDVEGDATSIYIKTELENRGLLNGITLTRLAKGIPTGSDIEFMSTQTLSDSIKSRIEF